MADLPLFDVMSKIVGHEGGVTLYLVYIVLPLCVQLCTLEYRRRGRDNALQQRLKELHEGAQVTVASDNLLRLDFE